ncbi:MAG: FG-GAP repeat domain-containing protein [Thermoanaerobaculia bacterium]
MRRLPAHASFLLAALVLAAPAPARTPPRCAGPGFAAEVPLPVPPEAVLVSLAGTGDVNGDGAPDVVLAAPMEGKLLVFRNDGHGAFPSVEAVAVDSAAVARLADVDGDGRADIVSVRPNPKVTHLHTGSLAIWISDGSTFLPMPPTEYDLEAPGIPPVFADVDDDGRVDVFFGRRLLRNLGGGLFAPSQLVPALSDLVLLAAADLNRDGNVDLLAATSSGPMAKLSLLAGDGRGGFTRGPAFFESLGASNATVADLDRDGRPDLVLTGSWKLQGLLDVLLADGTGGFRRTFAFSGYSGTSAIGDVDRDGVTDLVFSSATSGLSVFLGDGAGGFPRRVPISAGSGRPALADFDRDGALDLLRVPGSPPTLAAVLRNDCQPGEASRTLLVPVVASLPGANGAAYRTRLTVTSLSPVAAPVEVRFTPAEGEPKTAATLLAGELQASFDAAAFLEDLGIPAAEPARLLGTLRLTASGLLRPGDLAAEAWVSVKRAGEEPPSSGVSFPAIPVDEAFDGAVLLGGLREDGRDRTNLGLVNAGGPEEGDVVLRVTLFPGSPDIGAPVVLPDVRLGPGRVRQLDRVLALAGLSSPHAFARVERASGTARFFAWAVVNDEGTSDGSFLAAVPAGTGRGSRRLVVPSVVETGAYSTDLFLANASSAPKEVRLEWFAGGLAAPTSSVSLSLSLPAAGQLLLDDLVALFRAAEPAAIPPHGANLAGALFVTVGSGDVEGLLAGSRVTTPAAGVPGRFGVFLPAVHEEDLAREPVFLPVSQPACVARTNLAIVNAGTLETGAVAFRVDVRDGRTREVLRTESALLVGARGFLQLSPLVPPCAPLDRELVVTVTRTSGDAPFLAYAVVNDGARPGDGTGDGGVIGMRVEPAP